MPIQRRGSRDPGDIVVAEAAEIETIRSDAAFDAASPAAGSISPGKDAMLTFALQLAQSDSALSSTGANPIHLFENAFDGRFDLLNHPSELLSALNQVHPVWAVIFMIAGVITLLHGLRWHKPVIVILSGLVGVWAGMWLGNQIGGAHAVAGVSLCVLFAILALPALRFAVALFGGVAGAFVGANAWTAFGGDPTQHYFGSIIGLVALGMLAFLAFRHVIVLFTAIGGSTLTIFGAMAIMLRVDAWNSAMADSLSANTHIVPLLVGVTALVGMTVQEGGGVKGLNERANKASAKAEPQPKPA